MRIATITCHDVYNYGASLQAYALQEYCKVHGCDYIIIDYKPDYLSGHYSLRQVANPRFNHPVLKQLYLLAKLPGRIVMLKRKKRFDAFTRQYLHLSEKRYTSNDELKADTPAADLYIAGSDQIWNTLFRNGHDPAFYLDFAREKGRRISYAASFATEKIYNGAQKFVKNQVQDLDAVSVRESSALTMLKKLGRNDGILVVDPVFLLSKEQWLGISQTAPLISGDYIVVYDCERSLALRNTAEQLKQSTGLPIVSLSQTYGRYADFDFGLSGPSEFVNLIAHSQYVVTNSFHGLAFSLIFEKNFFILNRSEGINARTYDLLNYLGLGNRLVSSPQEINSDSIRFDKVNGLLASLIEDSRAFIKTQLQKTIAKI